MEPRNGGGNESAYARAEEATLLFLSGGSQVTQFILSVLDGRRESLRLLATSSICDDPGLWSLDGVFLTPTTAKEPEAFRARVLRSSGVNTSI